MTEFTKIRNFCIISHIDHGKSTLADRFLELTQTIPKEKMQPQYLDMMGLEREKGITIKMHPCRMLYQEYILNLIDTPGHIDFSYEISRALAAVEGAILLVDATKGIQAQTLFNLEMAQKQNLKIIGAVNKIDSSSAKVSEAITELSQLLKVPEKEIFAISAKNGTNVRELLRAVVEKIPAPLAPEAPSLPKALIFDSKYDSFFGVIAYVRVFASEIKKGEKIYLMRANSETEAKEIGYFLPELKETQTLKAGEIGYIKTGIKNPGAIKVGETIIKTNGQISKIEPLPEYQEPQSVLFLSLYSKEPEKFSDLKEGLSKLKLNDPALYFESETKYLFGQGFKCGFLGSLHAEITIRRLKEDFDLDIITTYPQVIFKILTKTGKEISIFSPADFPDPSLIEKIKEPWVKLKIITPFSYFNSVFKLIENFKGVLLETNSFGLNKCILIAEAPLKEILVKNFYEKLKNITSGYASFSFENIGCRIADLVKLDVFIAGEKHDVFSKIIDKEDVYSEGKAVVEKLKEILPAQQFSFKIQAGISKRIIASETIQAKRKDVTAPLYGGDVTRKRKLLEIQKRGKKELKKKGKITLSANVYLEMLKG